MSRPNADGHPNMKAVRMRPAVKAAFRFSDGLSRTTAVTTIKQTIPEPLGAVVDIAAADEDGKPRWDLLERHALKGTVTTVQTRALAQLALPSTLDGSRLQVHDCFHDEEPPRPCVVTGEWVKVAGSVVKVA